MKIEIEREKPKIWLQRIVESDKAPTAVTICAGVFILLSSITSIFGWFAGMDKDLLSSLLAIVGTIVASLTAYMVLGKKDE
jgi:hypothetical protein